MADRAFSRGLSDSALAAMEAASCETGHWFRDLLTLWRTHGTPSGTTGLRLAVRNGYLNFYRCGQSVAKVGHNGRTLQMKVHGKYVCEPAIRRTVTGYATLDGQSLRLPDGQELGIYEGVGSLEAWIGVINQEYCKPEGEKPLIDGLLGCPQNANVIDLEMALPAWKPDERVAPRMDLVTIENVRGRLTVVFGEVKVVTDGRIRCGPDKQPEVRVQLNRYTEYLQEPGHSEAIATAYSNAARVLLRIGSLATPVRGAVTFSEEIERAATGEPLEVAREAALIVLCDPKHSAAHWQGHRARLLDTRIPLVELTGRVPMNLGTLF